MSRSAVVVAHPDDEILWLSSVLAQAEPLILCFGAPYNKPEVAQNRAAAVAELKFPHLVNLAIPESGARLLVDYKHPRLTATGIAITETQAQTRYDENFWSLLEKLRPHLRGVRDVYTHNPWGEYGHSEHIQVYRAVQTLQQELGFTLWFSNYVAPRSKKLAREIGASPLWQSKRTVPTDLHIAQRWQKLYQKHHVWTWSNWYKWPTQETLYAQPAGVQQEWKSLHGECLLNVEALRKWRPVRSALVRF